MSGYPYRFYGASPSDWAEGANAGHVLSVQFERVPTSEELERLGRTYADALRVGRAEPASAAWAGRFLRLAFGERSRGHGSADHLGPLTRFMNAAHAIVAIRDAVYENAREATDAWSLWSAAIAPPDAGPAPGTPRFAAYRRGVDTSLPPHAPDARFDAGERASHEDSWRERIEAAIAAQVGQSVHLARVTRAVEIGEPEGDVTARRDGSVNARDVLEAIGQRPKERLRSSATLDASGTRMAIATSERLVLVDTAASPPRLVHENRSAHGALQPFDRGRGLLVRRADSRTVYAHTADRLVRVASIPELPVTFDREGRVVFGRGDFLFELVGFDDAYAAVEKQKPARRSAKAAPKVELVRVDEPEPALLERLSLTPSKLEARSGKAKVAESESGAHALCARDGARRLRYVDPSGVATELSEAVAPSLVDGTILGLALSPSGDSVIVRTHGRLLVARPATPQVVERVVDSLYLGFIVHPPVAVSDDLVVFTDGKDTFWQGRADDGSWSTLHRAKTPGGSWILAATAEAAVVYAQDPLKRKKSKFPLRVVGVRDGKCKELFKSERLFLRAAFHDGRVFVREPQGVVWELTGAC